MDTFEYIEPSIHLGHSHIAIKSQAEKREEEQTAADVARLSVWVESETAKGHVPTNEEICAEISRFVSEGL